MVGSVNKVILVGNLGRDPEVRSMQNGGKVCNLSVATSERWKDRNTGEQQEKTEWHRVVIFDDRLVDVAEKFLQKGRKVYLEGEIQTRKWQDKDGNDRWTTEISASEMQMLGSSNSPKGGSADNPPNNNQSPGSGASGNSNEFEPDLDIPF